jgi:hypothetical protein
MSAARRLAELPMLIMAALTVALLFETVSARIGYPFDLEWMEGGMLHHAQRVMDGQPLYVEPSSEFIPFIYPPLYHWVLGWSAKIFGLSYALGRTIALLGTLAAAAACAAAVAGERRGWLLGVGAGALYLTGYDESGSFFDLVRGDGLLMALLTWALVCGRRGWVKSAGILLVGAFLCKHTAALFGLPMLVWLYREHGLVVARRFAAWSVLPALGFTVALQLSGDGLFLTYLLGVPGVHPFNPERFAIGTPSELFGFAPYLIVASGLVVVYWAVAERTLSAGARYWAINGGLAILLSAVMRGHHGGYLNVLMPGLWAVSLGCVLAVGWVRERWPHTATIAVTSVLVAGQLWAGRWSPSKYTPQEGAVEAGEGLIDRLAAIDGELFAPHSPWYLAMAGKQPTVHLIALWDIDHKYGPLKDRVAVIRADMDAQRWSAVVLGSRSMGGDNDEYGVDANYRRSTPLPTGAMKPVTGWPARPRYIFTPRSR